MDIAEVARRSGVAASTLRYYERRGLIAPLDREGAGRRRYPPGVMNQLALIALGQAAGLSLDEIRTMVLPNGEARVDRGLLASKADAIDAQVLRLRAVSRGLRHAAACPAPSHAQCPTFQRLLKAAAAGALDLQREGGAAPPAEQARRARKAGHARPESPAA